MNTHTESINTSINNGLAFLAGTQQKEGYFLGFSSSMKNDFRNAKAYTSVFFQTLILSSLSGISEEFTARKINNKLAQFLLTQKSEQWSFNYCIRGSKEAELTPYPDDLDDTFCALSSLSLHDRSLIGSDALAKITTLLTFLEIKEGGPYKTWLVAESAPSLWKDVDVVVNSNIGYFLSINDIYLPHIEALVEQAIETKTFTSPYYPSPYPGIYFISRWYRGKKKKDLVDYIMSLQDRYGRWGNPLHSALAVKSLLNLGVPPSVLKKAVSYLLHQQKFGAWNAYSFCLNLTVEKSIYYAGAKELTTGFCVEALGAYLESVKENKRTPDHSYKKESSIMRKSEEKRLYEQIVQKAKNRFSALQGDIGTCALDVLKKHLQSDTDKQIVLMPYFFKISLGTQGRSISDSLLVCLGLANLYGWIAYTIYDDFLDNEGHVPHLPVANICLRELTRIFSNTLSNNETFPCFYNSILDRLEGANMWEVLNCRLHISNKKKHIQYIIPDYSDPRKLADRSLGHALGPLAILFELGYNDFSAEVAGIIDFFTYYLAARQLNDEAHDWEEDLRNGHVNAVAARIIAHAYEKNTSLKDLEHDIGIFQELFWYEIVQDVCDEMTEYIKKAEASLEKLSIIEDSSLLQKFLDSVKSSVEKTRKERADSLLFIETFSGNKSIKKV